MTTTRVFSVRIPTGDYNWLKQFAEQFPDDSVNAMMGRFIRSRIEEMAGNPDIPSPPYPLPKAPF